MQEQLLDGLNKKGFTMVELLVAMSMSLVVLAAVYMTFKTQLYTFQLAEQTAPVQQNVRVAKVFLERDIRMAGANMDGVAYPSSTSGENELLYPVAFENGTGAAGTDKLTIVYIDYYAGACGDPPAGGVSCDSFSPLSLSVVGMPEDAATANIAEDLDDAAYAPWADDDCYCNDELFGVPPTAANNDHRYRAIITSPDGTRSDIIFITGVNNTGGTNKIVNAPYKGFDNKVANSYPEGSTISFFSESSFVEVVYEVVDENGRLLLQRNGATIAENIEDLQFAFGLDTNDDGSVNSWENNALTPTTQLQVRMVRINILGRSSKEIGGTITSNRPAIEDHTASATQDRYKRRQLELTVKVRNLGI